MWYLESQGVSKQDFTSPFINLSHVIITSHEVQTCSHIPIVVFAELELSYVHHMFNFKPWDERVKIKTLHVSRMTQVSPHTVINDWWSSSQSHRGNLSLTCLIWWKLLGFCPCVRLSQSRPSCHPAPYEHCWELCGSFLCVELCFLFLSTLILEAIFTLKYHQRFFAACEMLHLLIVTDVWCHQLNRYTHNISLKAHEAFLGLWVCLWHSSFEYCT